MFYINNMVLPILIHKENKRWLRRHKKSIPKICPQCNKEKPLMKNSEGKTLCSECYFNSL